MQSKRPIIIGIAGGSGSGKTTIAHEIYDQLQQDDHILIMTQDSYYKNNDNLSMADRKKINYDHPDAFDMPLLVEQLRQLMDYKAVEMPVYDFTAHTRSEKTIHIRMDSIPYHKEAYEMADMGFVPAGAYRNRTYAEAHVRFEKETPLPLQDILFDPQTSGGLLIAVAQSDAEALLEMLLEKSVEAAIIGYVAEEEDVAIVIE